MEQVVLVLLLLGVGYFSGRIAERRHYTFIAGREAELRHIPAHTLKYPMDRSRPVNDTGMAVGHIVVSQDYFKRFSAILRTVAGGRMAGYETLIDRGRRAAIIRMKESCPGADEFINVRIETSIIGNSGTSRNGLGAIEVLACSTALYYSELLK